jgi:tetratricopeptide (TPR) repeat protein
MATYDAFISYSHARDKPIASALQSVLQRLGKPWYKRRSLRVFRDDTSLSATPHLWPTIEMALHDSRFLILLASPESASSPWVQKEVAYWLENKSIETLLIAVTQGSLSWDALKGDFSWSESPPLPVALKGRFSNEPRWVDLRNYRGGANPREHQFLDLAADFAAAIHGIPKEDLLSQEVRQQRRALSLAWSAATLLLALVTIAVWNWSSAVAEKKTAEVERNHAQQSQLRAEKNYASAKGTVDRLIYNVTQTIELSQGIRTDTVTRLLDAAKTTLDKLISENPDDLDLKATEATMLDEFAKFYVAAGDLRRASVVASQGVLVVRDLLAHDPANAGFADSQIIALARLGQIRFQTGAFGDAEEAFKEALNVRDALVTRSPLDKRGDITAASANIFIGFMQYTRGDISSAKASFDNALTLARGVDDKNGAFVQATQVLSLIGQAGIYWQAKDVDGARRALDDAVRLGHKVASENPDNFIASALVAGAIGATGDFAVSSKNLELARQAYKEAIELIRSQLRLDPGNIQLKGFATALQLRLDKLNADHPDQTAGAKIDQDSTLESLRAVADQDPENAESRYNLAVALEELGNRQLRAREFVAAIKSYGEERQLAQSLVTQEPTNFTWQWLLAISYEKTGDVYLQLQRASEARASFEGEVTIARRVLTDLPDNMEWRRLLPISLTKLGDAQPSSDELNLATLAYEETVSAARVLIANDESNTDWQRILVIGLDRLGGARSAAKRLQEARILYEEEVEICRSISDRDSDNEDWKNLFVIALDHSGGVYVLLSMPDAAQAAFDEESRIAKSALHGQPSNITWLRRLAVSLEMLGDARRSIGRLNEAQEAYEEDISSARALVASDPSNSDSQRILAVGLDRLANVNSGRRPPHEIEALYREEIEICRQVLAANQTNEDWNGRLANSLGMLADFKRADEDSEGARASYQEEADIARAFKDQNPASAYWHRLFVTSQMNLGDLHFRGRDSDSAASFYSEALAAARELSRLNPSVALWQSDVVLALWRNAQLKQRQSDEASAHALSLEALAITQRVERDNQLFGDAKQWPEMLRNEFKISVPSNQ